VWEARGAPSRPVQALLDHVLRQTLTTATLTHEFQPVWALEPRSLIGFEALARFPYGISPDVMFQYAASQGQGRPLDILSVRLAITVARTLPGLLFVNMHPDHVEPTPSSSTGAVGPTLTRYRRREALVLEMMEFPEHNRPRSQAGVDRLRRLGIRVALDDAGVRSSDLDRLAWLQPSFVKIDRSIVKAAIDGNDRLVREWVVQAGRIGATVVAEGVEDPTHAEWLGRLGVHWVQGYAFGRPAPAEQWIPLLLEAAAQGRLDQALEAFAPKEFDQWAPPPSPLTNREIGDLLFQDLPLPVVVIDESERVVGLNRAGETRWGLLASQAMRRPLADLGLTGIQETSMPVPIAGTSVTCQERRPGGTTAPLSLFRVMTESRARPFTVFVALTPPE
jgi:EAL domain-containing protein (putative c-di-GMP-specific phosphodiesterase class I)